MHLLRAIRFKLNFIKKLKHNARKLDGIAGCSAQLRAILLLSFARNYYGIAHLNSLALKGSQLRASKIHLCWKPYSKPYFIHLGRFSLDYWNLMYWKLPKFNLFFYLSIYLSTYPPPPLLFSLSAVISVINHFLLEIIVEMLS